MKGIGNGVITQFSLFMLISVFFFYLGSHFHYWSFQKLIFFSIQQNSEQGTPNLYKTARINPLTVQGQEGSNYSISHPPPLAQPELQRMGLLDENGRMTDDFEVGEYDPHSVEHWRTGNESDRKEDNEVKVPIKKFQLCPDNMRDYIPCLEGRENLNSTEDGEKMKFGRSCPEKGKELNCLIPVPKGYGTPIPWPRSRDEVWFSNAPYAHLAEDKGGSIIMDYDKFKFPRASAQFVNGVDQYLDQLEKMVSEIAFGRRTRVVLDVGCGVASFGAYLFSRNVTTLSIAPKDVHGNLLQVALERGVPAMVAAFGAHRLLYPSQAFDLIHCSWCRINWTHDDGMLLLEVNRMLRAGGHFVWGAQPVYKNKTLLKEQLEEMINVTNHICWTLVKKDGYIVIWQKPLNNSCYLSRKEGNRPPLCERGDDPDNVWHVNLKACISRLPDEGYWSNVAAWPERLHNPPVRLQNIRSDALISGKEIYRAESKYWSEIVAGYIRILDWKRYNFRNVLDMRAVFGGFAAGLIENNLDCWVLNVVPVTGPNTLPVIYDRGLIGVMHDWCEPFDTYPRTYDLIHAAGLFSIERKRCDIWSILVEMDRMLRPGGHVYIRDTKTVIDEIEQVGRALGWYLEVRETSQGHLDIYRILACQKPHK